MPGVSANASDSDQRLILSMEAHQALLGSTSRNPLLQGRNSSRSESQTSHQANHVGEQQQRPSTSRDSLSHTIRTSSSSVLSNAAPANSSDLQAIFRELNALRKESKDTKQAIAHVQEAQAKMATTLNTLTEMSICIEKCPQKVFSIYMYVCHFKHLFSLRNS